MTEVKSLILRTHFLEREEKRGRHAFEIIVLSVSIYIPPFE
jgi:hypothetical protein